MYRDKHHYKGHKKESTRALASSAYRLAKHLQEEYKPETKVWELTQQNIPTNFNSMTPVILNQIPLGTQDADPTSQNIPISERIANQVHLIGLDIRWSELTDERYGNFRIIIYWDESNVVSSSTSQSAANEYVLDARAKPQTPVGVTPLTANNTPALAFYSYNDRHNFKVLYDKTIHWNAFTPTNDGPPIVYNNQWYTHKKHIQLNHWTTFSDPPNSNVILTGALKMIFLSSRTSTIANDFSYNTRLYFTDS